MKKLNNGTKNTKLAWIVRKAWRTANKGALGFGGSPKEYFAESLRMAWADSKESFENSGLKLLRYTKTDGTDSYTVVSRCEEKQGKNGVYYQAHGLKGTRNYKNAVIMEFTKENVAKLEKSGFTLAE
jgi:hypothetical protein